jgi:hypothetical protein
MAGKLTKWLQKYTSIFHWKTLQNLPKFVILGLKMYPLATLPFARAHLLRTVGVA